jgi:NADH-quinone oxidoreductase subunit J
MLLAAVAPILHPVVILVLCIGAGVGTVLMLPGRRETAWAKLGGVLALSMGLIFAALLVRFSSSQGAGPMGVYFWLFSAIAIIAALRVVTHPRPVYSALYFVMTVLASAGLFILMWAEFMAAALVVIYAGAILVTYVFVIMLAQQAQSPHAARPMAGLADYDNVSREPVVAATIGFVLMGVLMFVILDKAEGLERPANPPNVGVYAAAADHKPAAFEGTVQQLGQYLFNDQVINLELAGLILTIAMVGAIVIARRRIVPTDAGVAEFVETPEPEVLQTPLVALPDDPGSVPVYGTDNPRAKAYPEA